MKTAGSGEMGFYDNPQSLDSNDDDDDDKVQLQLIANVSMKSGKIPRLTLPHSYHNVMLNVYVKSSGLHYHTFSSLS